MLILFSLKEGVCDGADEDMFLLFLWWCWRFLALTLIPCITGVVVEFNFNVDVDVDCLGQGGSREGRVVTIVPWSIGPDPHRWGEPLALRPLKNLNIKKFQYAVTTFLVSSSLEMSPQIPKRVFGAAKRVWVPIMRGFLGDITLMDGEAWRARLCIVIFF